MALSPEAMRLLVFCTSTNELVHRSLSESELLLAEELERDGLLALKPDCSRTYLTTPQGRAALHSAKRESQPRASYWIDCWPFNGEGRAAKDPHSSGPWSKRDEAERAAREALGTGRFAKVCIREGTS